VGNLRGSTGKKQQTKENIMEIPMLAEISGSIHVGLAALGAALGVGFIGMKASEAVGRNPGAATPILVQAILSTAFAEGIVFFAIFLVK
jgi:F-type H+-transporting ATPase subunit c